MSRVWRYARNACTQHDALVAKNAEEHRHQAAHEREMKRLQSKVSTL